MKVSVDIAEIIVPQDQTDGLAEKNSSASEVCILLQQQVLGF